MPSAPLFQVLILSLVLGAIAFGQPAAPPAHKKPAAVQAAPGEGDSGDSEAMDEAADTKPHAGPYRSPYKLAFKAPLHDLLFDVNTPRVIDSTGGRIKDSDGHAIPCGIQLRPFKKGSWYHGSFDHAHRWVK